MGHISLHLCHKLFVVLPCFSFFFNCFSKWVIMYLSVSSGVSTGLITPSLSWSSMMVSQWFSCSEFFERRFKKENSLFLAGKKLSWMFLYLPFQGSLMVYLLSLYSVELSKLLIKESCSTWIPVSSTFQKIFTNSIKDLSFSLIKLVVVSIWAVFILKAFLTALLSL